jgi:hypothetical protein
MSVPTVFYLQYVDPPFSLTLIFLSRTRAKAGERSYGDDDDDAYKPASPSNEPLLLTPSTAMQVEWTTVLALVH